MRNNRFSELARLVYNRVRSKYKPPATDRTMTRGLTAVLVDDERLARKELTKLLARHPEITIVGEAKNVPDALLVIGESKPDVVFLDIQMPGQSGFDLLRQIDVSFRVVFVTAYDSFALRAFEVNALDYLLKPVEPARLADTVARLLNVEPAAPAERSFKPDDAVYLVSGNRRYLIPFDRIRFIQAERDYSLVVTTDDQRVLAHKTMAEWEADLAALHFQRIHRSTIINLNAVERIERISEGTYTVRLSGEADPLPISRRLWPDIRARLER